MTLLFSILVVIFFLYLFWRNAQVFKYRTRLLNRVSHAAQVDIAFGIDYRWRYDAFDKVSYDAMILKFWKSLPSFYKDFKFAEPSVSRARG